MLKHVFACLLATLPLFAQTATVDLGPALAPINAKLADLDARLKAIESVPVPTPPAPPAPSPSGKRAPTWPADFEYVGVFRAPMTAGGVSTAYGLSGLAVSVDAATGKRTFMASAHRNQGGPLYLFDDPDLRDTDKNPNFAHVPYAPPKEFVGMGPYGTKRTTPSGAIPGNLPDVTHGLYFDRVLNRVFVSFGNLYPATGDGATFPSLMAFDPSTGESEGPWSISGISAQRTRGCVFRLPPDVAAAVGKTHAAGAGGYYSIVGAGASQGPSLVAFTPGAAGAVEMVGYPHGGKRCVRPATISNGPLPRDADGSAGVSWDSPTLDANALPGRWTASDTILGAACWIETASLSGPLFFASLGEGVEYYDRGGPDGWRGEVRADSYKNFVYSYSAKDLIDVAKGRKDRTDPAPVYAPLGLEFPHAQVTGVATDGNLVFLMVHWVWSPGYGPERYPAIAVFRAKG